MSNKKLAKNITTIIIILISVVITKLSLNVLYQTEYDLKVNQDEVFSEKTIKQIEEYIKPKSDIYVSSIHVTNNELLNFSIHFVEPINETEFKVWFVIYNANEEHNDHKTPYTLFYNKKYEVTNYDLPKMTIRESFEILEGLQPHFKDIFDIVPKDVVKGELKSLVLSDTYNEKVDLTADTFNIKVKSAVEIRKGVNPQEINDDSFFLFNVYDDENLETQEDFIAVVTMN